jgi:hypothetical protein
MANIITGSADDQAISDLGKNDHIFLKKALDGFCIQVLITSKSFTKLIQTMKTKFYLLGLAIMLSLGSLTTVSASTGNTKEAVAAKVATMTAEQKEARVKEIKLRVEEIRHMSKSTLNRAERKELRSELRSMKYEANALGGGGVYLSLAGIIIIILLLILIL